MKREYLTTYFFRARRFEENAFGILANRFRILLTTMRHNPSAVKIIVKASIILHNLIRIRYPRLQNQLLDCPESDHTDFIHRAWRQNKNLEDTPTAPAATRHETQKGKR